MGLLLLSLVACGPSEDAFKEQYIETACEKTVECYEGKAMMSVDECTAFLTLYSDELWGGYADCTYSSSNASKCLNAVSGLECGYSEADYAEVTDVCSSVWEC